MPTVRTRCGPSRLIGAVLLFAAAFAWPGPGFGQWVDEVALDLAEPPVALAVGADGRIAIAGPNLVELRDRSGGLLNTLLFGAMPEGCCVRDLAFDGAALLIARSPSWEDREGAGGTLGGLYRWSGQPDEGPVDVPVGGCSDIAVAIETDTVATACIGAVQLWDFGARVGPTTVHERPAAAIAVNAAGTRLAVADRLSVETDPAADDSARPASLYLYDITNETPAIVAETALSGTDIRQLHFLPDGDLVSRDAGGAISIIQPDKMTSRLVTEHGPLANEAGNVARLALGPNGRLLAGDLSGPDGGVLIDLATGAGIATPADVPMRGAGHWAFLGGDGLLWAGRPPTYPHAILRWFDLPALQPIAPK